MERRKMGRRRIGGSGIVPGIMKTRPKNKITDMPGALVGHRTVRSGDNRTNVTVIVPGPGNVLDRKFIAAGYVHNGLGKIYGLIQVEELGALGAPIALASTLNVGLAADALVEYTIRQCAKGQVKITSVNPVVGGRNDCKISRIQHGAVSIEDVMEAFFRADKDFEEDDVGAGTGTVCYGLKGGIGSVSRIARIGGKRYTLRILVQLNFEATRDLVINGIRADERILEEKERHREMAVAEQDRGSIMTIVATDPPISGHQLKYTIHRAGVGIARIDAYTGHGSGEVMIGFTTAGRLQGKGSSEVMTSTCTRGDLASVAFKVIAETVHEAILNSMTVTGHTGGLAEEMCYSLSGFLLRVLKH